MNILTFDIEEWFHILDNNSTKYENDWNKYEVRIHKNMDRIFDFLISNKLKATFFIVGWIAKKYPEIIKKIDSLGFEIGSHSNMHQLFYELSENEANEDIRISIECLENLIGKKVRCFRAPGFSFTEKNKWVFEILHKNGITHDCSIFPAFRSHGGLPNFKSDNPIFIKYNGIVLKEFPINIKKLMGMKFIFSGGGYFRLLPYYLINKFSKKSPYIMTYFHPRDFDYSQPYIKDLSLFKTFKSYVGLNTSLSKLNKWVNDYEFIDLNEADKKINWSSIPTIKI